MDSKKPMLGLLLSSKKSPLRESEEPEEKSEDKDSDSIVACEAILEAIEKGDAKLLAEALQSYKTLSE